MSPNSYYVYALFRPNGHVCYIGKGRGKRMNQHFRPSSLKTMANRHLANIILKAGGRLPCVKIRNGLTNAEAIAIEVAFIAAIGRLPNGPLVNRTDGGEGNSGWSVRDESRKKMRAKAISRMKNSALRQHLRDINTGKKHTEATRAKMRTSHRGKPPAWSLDPILREKTIKKMRRNRKNRVISAEWKAKIRAGLLEYNKRRRPQENATVNEY